MLYPQFELTPIEKGIMMTQRFFKQGYTNLVNKRSDESEKTHFDFTKLHFNMHMCPDAPHLEVNIENVAVKDQNDDCFSMKSTKSIKSMISVKSVKQRQQWNK